MKVYTYQVGDGAGSEIKTVAHSETLYADSFGEAIDKAKALTNTRPAHVEETVVRIVESNEGAKVLWARPIEDVRKG